jgi:hypothetical protein
MNRSVAAGNQASAIPPPLPPAMLNPAVTLAEPPVPQGFRELVEYRCAQQGILFVPLANRRQSGRPVFRVGNVLCYFDRQVAFVMSPNGMWDPHCGCLFQSSNLWIWQ